MLIFMDETFRDYTELNGSCGKFGALCGVAIPVSLYGRLADDVFRLKLNMMGKEYAEESEIKGKNLLSNRSLKDDRTAEQKNKVDFVFELLKLMKKRKLVAFGNVCFNQSGMAFVNGDKNHLDDTFKDFCKRVDIFMKKEHKDQKAIIVSDGRQHGTDKNNSTAITRFLVKTSVGRSMRSSILDVPFFAISQADNVGIQLADLITTIIGRYAQMNSSGVHNEEVQRLFDALNFYSWQEKPGLWLSTLRWHKKSVS